MIQPRSRAKAREIWRQMGRASSAKQLSDERLQDNESFCIGDEAMQLDMHMVKRADEEEEDLDSAQVDE